MHQSQYHLRQLRSCVEYCHRLEELGVAGDDAKNESDWSSKDSYEDSAVWATYHAGALIWPGCETPRRGKASA